MKKVAKFYTLSVVLGAWIAAASAFADSIPVIQMGSSTPGATPTSTPPLPLPTPSGGPVILPGPPTTNTGGCGPRDPDCRNRLRLILGGIHIAELSVTGGVKFGDGATDGAVRFSATGAATDSPMGDISLLNFEFIDAPDQGGFRLRITTIHADVMFFCKDQDDGKTHLPLTDLAGNCAPDQMWGIGVTALQMQGDPSSNEWAMRWAELNLVLNVLANGNGMDYLHERLMAFVGADGETFFGNGNNPNSDAAGTRVRLNMGIMGMIRSNDNKWELNGYAGFRPDVTNFDNWGAEVRTQLLYHLLTGGVQTVGDHPVPNYQMIDIGLEGDYAHWTDPSQSFGDFTSETVPDSFYVGLLFKLTYW